MIPKIVLGLFIISTITQLFYWLYGFLRLAFHQDDAHENSQHSVTTIISARNEVQNLQNKLHRILNQNYHSHHVIIVNDNSTDTTEQFLLNYPEKHKTFTLVNAIESLDSKPGKKQALTQGIEKATTEVLLMTDADCTPISDKWVERMQEKINAKTEIVLGFSPYTSYPGWLNKLIRFDTLMIAIQYFTMALIGRPYMGVGRNMAYKKSLFVKNKGFQNHLSIASGDDDLFVQEVATKDNTAICLDKESFIETEPKRTWKDFLIQKSRHVTTGKNYKLSHQIILAIFLISLMVQLVGGIGLMTQLYCTKFVLTCMIIRLLIAWTVFALIAKRLNSGDLIKWFPILESSYLILNIILTPTLLTLKPTKWK